MLTCHLPRAIPAWNTTLRSSQNKNNLNRTSRATTHTTMASAKRVLVPIGTGSEEMEAVITIDVLRRAGAEVTVASVETALEVHCSRGVKIVADKV